MSVNRAKLEDISLKIKPFGKKLHKNENYLDLGFII